MSLGGLSQATRRSSCHCHFLTAGEPGFGLNMLHEVPLDSGDDGQKAADIGVNAEMSSGTEPGLGPQDSRAPLLLREGPVPQAPK